LMRAQVGLQRKITVIEDLDLAVSLVRKIMGRYHGYYAKESRRLNARGLVLFVDGHAVWSTVIYEIKDSINIGVIYYVVVEKEFRGKGLGKILVLSAEEVLSSDKNEIIFLATISRKNIASIKMFESLGYAIINLDDLYDERPILYEVIKKATCGYEDDIAALKVIGTSFERALLLLEEMKPYAERAWRKACYMPWLESLRRGLRI
jgi:ribosomal protein S18 acetylase RimI-like enzyme